MTILMNDPENDLGVVEGIEAGTGVGTRREHVREREAEVAVHTSNGRKTHEESVAVAAVVIEPGSATGAEAEAGAEIEIETGIEIEVETEIGEEAEAGAEVEAEEETQEGIESMVLLLESYLIVPKWKAVSFHYLTAMNEVIPIQNSLPKRAMGGALTTCLDSIVSPTDHLSHGLDVLPEAVLETSVVTGARAC
ncbi:hypothetical protein BP6252_00659 [Coleophoma cylindrospora]|uniref:Uncharacterized protein n=1 Tax=Coleophoma cylindrospora TaxID=1849047 RepID=A0A3D8SQQ3_9HELO|nr:hypothetical protein BP6252_00659 [Coleophoma cylindrospora]